MLSNKYFVISHIVALFLIICFNAYSQNSRIWSTYYGGTGGENGYDVAVDPNNNVYMVCQDEGGSTGLTTNGYQNVNAGKKDVLIVKFDSNGNRLWATYFGGTQDDFPYVAHCDDFGNLYVAGETWSQSGIAFSGFQNNFGGGNKDAFLVKFDSNGNRLWATYFGGANLDYAYGISTDKIGNVYMSGTIDSVSSLSNFISGGFQTTYGGGETDAFLVKFDSNGNHLWSTYYGGTGREFESGAVSTDGQGNIYLTGSTNSTTGIAFGGHQNVFGGNSVYYGDLFLVKFDSNGNRIWSTYYGGTGEEFHADVACDSKGDIYIAGSTNSPNNIAMGGYQNVMNQARAFIAKFNGNGNRIWGTYYGGGGDETWYNSLAIDKSDNVYFSAETVSPTGIAYGGFQNNLIGNNNYYVVKFDPNCNRMCASYFGVDPTPHGVRFGGIELDHYSNLYACGMTFSSSGIASGGFQNTFGGNADAFLIKFTSCYNSTVTISSTDNLCHGTCLGTATAQSYGVPPFIYSWNTIPAQTGQTATGLCAGTYTVSITDSKNFTATSTVTISEPSKIDTILTFQICQGNSIALPNGGIATSSGVYIDTVSSYFGCDSIVTTNLTVLPSPFLSKFDTVCSSNGYVMSNGVILSTSGLYYDTITISSGCDSVININLTVIPSPNIITSGNVVINFGESAMLSAYGGLQYSWFPKTYLNIDTGNLVIAKPNNTTIYCVEVTSANGCKDTSCLRIEIPCPEKENLKVPNAFSPNGDLVNDDFCLQGWEACLEYFEIDIYDRWGERIFHSTEPGFCWDGKYRGAEMDAQVFVHYIKATFYNFDKPVILKGNISLLR